MAVVPKFMSECQSESKALRNPKFRKSLPSPLACEPPPPPHPQPHTVGRRSDDNREKVAAAGFISGSHQRAGVWGVGCGETTVAPKARVAAVLRFMHISKANLLIVSSIASDW